MVTFQHHRSPIQKLKKSLTFLLTLFFVLFSTVSVFSSEAPKDQTAHLTESNVILVLHSSDSEFLWNKTEADGIREIFGQTYHFNIFSEFLDLKRFPLPEYYKRMAENIRNKYDLAQGNVSGIIVADDQALKLFHEHLSQHIPDIPIVACGINGFVPAELTLNRRNFRVLFEEPAYEETLDLIIKLHPEMKRIVLVGDKTLNAVGQVNRMVEILKSRKIPYLRIGEKTFVDSAQELEKLTDDDVVIRLSFFEDSTGKILSVNQAMTFLSTHTQRPIYSFWLAHMGKGLVGGKMISGELHGKKASYMLKQLIDIRQDPNKITYKIHDETDPSAYYFDYPLLLKFNINREILPEGSIIINQPFSFFENNKKLSLIIIFVILILLIFASLMFWINVKLRQAREELVQAKQKSDEANSLKSRFLAIMSHEIRTPLSVVLGFADLLAAPNISEEQKNNYLDKISRNGLILSNLINEILDLSHIEGGHLKINNSVFSLKELLIDVTCCVKLRAQEKNIELLTCSGSPIPISLFSDALRIRQILTNLISNAIKFTEKGFIKIEVSTVDKYLVFAVEDSGLGLTDAEAKKIFEPFYQVDSSMTRKQGGAGLGLTISRTLAQALGGGLELDTSELNKGCRFRFYIPFDDSIEKFNFSSLKELEVEYVPKSYFASSDVIVTGLEGLKVLYAEDTIENQILISSYLQSAGVVVDIAKDGAEALQKAMAGHYDIILMDIQMPVLDGIETTLRLRKMGFKKPIIAVTAQAMKEQKEISMKSGFNEHLTKPIQRQTLLATISKLI